MDLTNSVKRAPKWAFLTAGGVALGIVGIKVWKGRATDSTAAASQDATQVGAPTTVGGGATPVITPPVIISAPQGDNGAMSDILTGLFGNLGGSLDNAVNTIGQLASGDQDIARTALGANTDIATTAIANAGSPPAPAAQSPIIVTIPAPGSVASPVQAPAVAHCPAAFPNHNPLRGPASPHSCYKCTHEGRTYAHRYQDGGVVGGNSSCD